MHPEKYDLLHNLIVMVQAVGLTGILFGIGATIHHIVLRLLGKK
jgi:hypothetical protein